MDKRALEDLLDNFSQGRVSKEEVLNALRDFPYIDLGFARLDTHRPFRRGIDEVVFCKGKAKEHVRGIAKALSTSTGNVVFTHVDDETFDVIRQEISDIIYYREAQIAASVRRKISKPRKGIAVVTAGTSDIRVAEEAAVIAEILGNEVIRIYDVGVAGIHRLFPHLETLRKSNVVVAVAGMEGALVTVVAGLISSPVIAVPTSVGYGSHFSGLSSLLAMLNTCVPGIGVVNIDNGFGAGVLAHMINSLAYRGGSDKDSNTNG
ncbi:MAG: nickel pincer cofactor biosynthesis protein LarB [Synergistetes bacterium]|nr:nickel pincer cofactor biosynthesis protein LarB [Synergistota bacterium]